jgi:hypothetical protein
MSEAEPGKIGPDSSGYEEQDVNPNKLILYGVTSVIMVAVVVVFMFDYFTATKEEMISDMVLEPESVALRELRAREAEELGSYKLLDPVEGVYRLPIERAMELVADEAYRRRTDR